MFQKAQRSDSTLTWIVPVACLYQVTKTRRMIQSNLSGHLQRLASRVETSYSKDLAIPLSSDSLQIMSATLQRKYSTCQSIVVTSIFGSILASSGVQVFTGVKVTSDSFQGHRGETLVGRGWMGVTDLDFLGGLTFRAPLVGENDLLQGGGLWMRSFLWRGSSGMTHG